MLTAFLPNEILFSRGRRPSKTVPFWSFKQPLQIRGPIRFSVLIIPLLQG